MRFFQLFLSFIVYNGIINVVLVRSIIMPYIKKQNIRYSSDGSTIISGTAAIAASVYDPSRPGHNRKANIESLGKAIWLSSDGKEGIFLSPSRGLVSYNSVSDSFSTVDRDDPRISSRDDLFPEPEIHTIFGDTYLLLKFMERTGYIGVLHSVFRGTQDYERCMCHILHTILRNGARKSCDDFISQSFVSCLFTDIPLKSLEFDTRYFTQMGMDHNRVAFFRSYIAMMRKKHPRFGMAAYVDSTPLPNDIQSLVADALCSHGLKETSNQVRLVLVLDAETNLPVWYSLIPGNILDLNTLETIASDVLETLDVTITSYVLDAGYLSKKMLSRFNNDSEMLTDMEGNSYQEKIIAKMPARNGFPYRMLYDDWRPFLTNVEYQFDRESHTYFGAKQEAVIFGYRIYAYIYNDLDNSLKAVRDFRYKYPEEYENMGRKEQDWQAYKGGYFVLLSNYDDTPERILRNYFFREAVELQFKTAKDFLELLPLGKWNGDTVNGKILNDIISSTIFTMMRTEINAKGKAATKLIGRTQSLICTRKRDGDIMIDQPSKQVRELYGDMKLEVPHHLDTDEFKKQVLGLRTTE